MEPESDEDSDFDDESVREHRGDSKDWFLEAGEDMANSSWDTEELSGIDWSECCSLVDVDLDSDTVEPDEIAAQVSAGNADAPHAEIYDSGDMTAEQLCVNLCKSHSFVIEGYNVAPFTNIFYWNC